MRDEAKAIEALNVNNHDGQYIESVQSSGSGSNTNDKSVIEQKFNFNSNNKDNSQTRSDNDKGAISSLSDSVLAPLENSSPIM